MEWAQAHGIRKAVAEKLTADEWKVRVLLSSKDGFVEELCKAGEKRGPAAEIWLKRSRKVGTSSGPGTQSCRLCCRVYFWLSLSSLCPFVGSCCVLGRVYCVWLNLRSPIRFGLQTVLRCSVPPCAFVVHVDGLSVVLLAFGEVKCRLLQTESVATPAEFFFFCFDRLFR